MAQDHGLCRKRKGKKSQMDRRTGRHCRPVLQLPTGQFSQLANMLLELHTTMILAHMDLNRANKQKQMNGGKMLMRAVGMAGKDGTAGKTQPAEQGTAGRHSRQTLRPAHASKQTATVGRPRSENNSCHKVGLLLTVQCR